MHFLLSGLSLILIDLLLAGDNALVIALAVRSLAPGERRMGITGGAIAAVVLRVALTFAAAQLMAVKYLQMVGGFFVLWIAVKVLIDASEPPDVIETPTRFWQAIWYIVVADITMSVDNILAIAGASHGHFWLILFGLAVSIPFVVFSSNLLCRMMDRWPALVLIGSGILGKVAGEMILADPFVAAIWRPDDTAKWSLEAALATGLMTYGWWRARRAGVA